MLLIRLQITKTIISFKEVYIICCCGMCIRVCTINVNVHTPKGLSKKENISTATLKNYSSMLGFLHQGTIPPVWNYSSNSATTEANGNAPNDFRESIKDLNSLAYCSVFIREVYCIVPIYYLLDVLLLTWEDLAQHLWTSSRPKWERDANTTNI